MSRSHGRYVLVVWDVPSPPGQVLTVGDTWPGDLMVSLGDVDFGWTPRKDIGIDRWYYDVLFERPLLEGDRNREIGGQAPRCSVEVLNYGSPEE